MISKRTVLTIIFLVTCVASTAWLALSTVNYVEFFRAVETFNLQLRDVGLIESGDNVEVSMIFDMINPTSYRGFKLREFSYKLSFNTNGTVPLEISSDTLSHASNPLEVTPYWNQTFTHHELSNAARSTVSLLRNLYDTGNQTITWTLEVTVILLNPLIDIIDIPLSSSLEMSINRDFQAIVEPT